MVDVRPATLFDEAFWYKVDIHLPKALFKEKVRTGMLWIACLDHRPAGILRMGLFWDQLPFLNLLYIQPEHQRQDVGRALVTAWEKEMGQRGYPAVLTSTQSDEAAQHFYRKLGYQDCGCLMLTLPKLAQPMELFFIKSLG